MAAASSFGVASYDAVVPLRRLALVLVLLTGLAWLGGPAGAHTQVQRATPGPGASVDGIVDFVELDFLDPVLPTPTIEVTGPDGAPVAGLGEARLLADDVARVGFDPLTAAGEYRVDYTFVALDGDEQTAAHTFSFEPSDDGLAVRPILAGLVGAVLVVLVAAALLGRRRARG